MGLDKILEIRRVSGFCLPFLRHRGRVHRIHDGPTELNRAVPNINPSKSTALEWATPCVEFLKENVGAGFCHFRHQVSQRARVDIAVGQA